MSSPEASAAKRHPILMLVLVLVFAGAAVFWYQYLNPAAVPGPPARTAAQLAGLPDELLVGQSVLELSRQVYHVDLHPKAPWRRLEAPGRAVWVVANGEARLGQPGTDLVGVQQGLRSGADLPDFTELQTACQEVGLPAAAARMGEIIAQLAAQPEPGAAERRTLGRLQAAWLAEVGSPAAQRTRVAFIRQHLATIAP